jgi:hypothetical protein
LYRIEWKQRDRVRRERREFVNTDEAVSFWNRTMMDRTVSRMIVWERGQAVDGQFEWRLVKWSSEWTHQH